MHRAHDFRMTLLFRLHHSCRNLGKYPVFGLPRIFRDILHLLIGLLVTLHRHLLTPKSYNLVLLSNISIAHRS